MTYKKSPLKQLEKTALYKVWRRMIRMARKEYNFFVESEINRDFPVNPAFREFPKFALWARLAGYVVGADDMKVIVRRNPGGDWGPDNCYFTDKPDINDEYSVEIGASGTAYRKAHAESKQRQRIGGLSATRLYSIWKGIKERCLDPRHRNYPNYGGRGIKICDKWRKDFMAFYNWAWEHGYSPEFTLDRVNFNGNYCPENCRWASAPEQHLNTRAYDKKYTIIRLSVSDTLAVLGQMQRDCVVTLIAKSDELPDIPPQTDYPQVPACDRIDVKIRNGG